MKWLQRLCGALVLALLVAAQVVAAPALWVAKSPTATVYLFGTMHVLPAGAEWHDPALDEALAASSKLYVEEDDDDPVTMQILVLQYGMDLWHPLSGKLDASERVRLNAAAKAAGIAGGAVALDSMQPWLAALTISLAPMLKAGLDPKSGADKQLQREFRAAGKPVGAFETAEQQIRRLADLPQAVQLNLLRSALDDYAEGPAQLDALTRAWLAGDVASISAHADLDMRRHYPQVYAAMLVERNHNFAGQIEGLLRQSGTVFVAIGAAHLAGPDSVQVELAKLGIRSERVH